MKISYIVLFSLLVSVDSYAMNDDEIEMYDIPSSVTVSAPSVNGKREASTLEQDLSVSPLMLAPAYTSATDASWDKEIDTSVTKKAIFLQKNEMGSRELELLNRKRKKVQKDLKDYSNKLEEDIQYQKNNGSFDSPSKQTIGQMQWMEQKGILVNYSLNEIGFFLY